MDRMGEDTRVRRLDRAREDEFPNLNDIGYRVTSDESTLYNCVAYAADDMTRKWDYFPPHYWPGKISGDAIEALESVFISIGYARCDNGDLEDGFQKVALYVNEDGEWEHAAKQLENGEWTSKLGNWEDIRHRTPHVFGGSDYGNVMYYMKRKIAILTP